MKCETVKCENDSTAGRFVGSVCSSCYDRRIVGLYGLPLHETLHVDPGLAITRVPGGWIYRTWSYLPEPVNDWVEFATVFVPYDTGFLNEKR